MFNFLWRCAGKEPELMLEESKEEQRKYFSFGLYVLLTGIFATFSIFYGAMIAFDSVIVGILVGLFMGFLIFNIYRYIILSIGYRIGVIKHKREPFFNALPRVLITGIIGLSIAKPIELGFFHFALNNQREAYASFVTEEQLILLEDKYKDIEENQEQLLSLQSEVKEKEQKVDELKEQLKDSTQSPQQLSILKEEFDTRRQELQTTSSQNTPEIQNLQQEIDNRITAKEAERNRIQNQALNSFSLLGRITMLHKKYPATWLITVIVLGFYVLPILNLYKMVQVVYWVSIVAGILFFAVWFVALVVLIIWFLFYSRIATFGQFLGVE